MKRGITIGLAAALVACGAAPVINEAAESATQRTKQKARPDRPVTPDLHFDQGGMAGCFDPNLSGYARRAAEEIGGVPCEAEPVRRTTRPAAIPAAPTSQASWIVGRWVSRGTSCSSGEEGVAYNADGTYANDATIGRWQFNRNMLIEVPLHHADDEEGSPEISNPSYVISQILTVAPNRNAFSIRYPDGRVWHMVRCR